MSSTHLVLEEVNTVIFIKMEDVYCQMFELRNVELFIKLDVQAMKISAPGLDRPVVRPDRAECSRISRRKDTASDSVLGDI